MVVSVLVVDDSEIMRRGLAEVLEASRDVHVVGQAWDGHSAVEAARQFVPDVALVDIRMPGMDGLTATRRLRLLPRPPFVVILTMFGEDEYLVEALDAGVSGFLLKNTPPDQLVRAILLVAQGHSMVDPAVTGRIMQLATARRQAEAGGPELTGDERVVLASLGERDRELLVLIGQGQSNAQIAGQLGAGEGTVRGQVSRLLSRLGLDNRVQAALLAYRAGLSR
ncbi:response regulator transcription factor [Streptomyces blastmyceticus]|uniref:Response regulator transcription factor n=1 Tax=Streptomyces blastmyceticus TaxID=68180 RepID=A0ABP3GIX0_9ACTN